MTSVFICHTSRDERFALGLAAYLKRYLDEVFCFEEQQRADGSFVVTINEKIAACKVFVTIVGEVVSDWQILEAASACQPQGGRAFFTITLPDPSGAPYPIPAQLNHLRTYPVIEPEGDDQSAIRSTAARIARKLDLPERSADLPLDPHLFSYEKDIVTFFIKTRLEKIASSAVSAEDHKEIREKIFHGCPQEWPEVVKWAGDLSPNQLSSDEVGIWRKESARVLTTGLVNEETLPMVAGSEQDIALRRLGFPEAGPRERLYFAKEQALRVAILVSGGIAPGINAVIDGIVQRHWLYAEKHGYCDSLNLMGLRNGFRSFDDLVNNYILLAGSPRHYKDMPRCETWNHVNEGGSILGTSRVDELIDPDRRESELKNIVGTLKGVDILYVIGGDGSMKAAHALWSIAKAERRSRGEPPLSVVAVPKTMDNDILWVWQSFGFLSAVEKAREVIEQLNTEVRSNPRLCIAQLFGSDSGFVVSHAVLASGTGHCDLALIPEVEFSMENVAHYLTGKMSQNNQHIPHGLVVLAETAIPNDAFRYVGPPGGSPEIDIGLSRDERRAIRDFIALREKKRRVQGQTNDALRTAGLKIVSRGLEKLLPHRKRGMTDWSKLRVFTNEPRHLLRAIPPSSSDIIIGHRLGTLAVDNAMAGYTDFMISQWLTEYVLVPLELVVLGRKRIPQEGIFWKSVLAKTGQPAKLTGLLTTA